MESGPGALPSFKRWRTAINSFSEKFSKIFTGSGVVAFQSTEPFQEISRDDLR